MIIVDKAVSGASHSNDVTARNTWACQM